MFIFIHNIFNIYKYVLFTVLSLVNFRYQHRQTLVKRELN